MRLIDEIIELLTRENPNVEAALTKTKVLLYRLGEEELAGWVNAELNGYTGDQEVPVYRIIPTRVRATATDGMTVRWPNIELPIAHLPQQMKNDLKNTKVGHSVAELQHFAAASEESLSKPLSPEFYRLLGKGLEKGIFVENAHVAIGRSQIVGILAQIKSRLLDFILQVSSRMPNDTPDSEMKSKSKEIDTAGLFQNAIFGNNTTILVGNANTQNTTNINIQSGNFESLAEYLRGYQISDQDIQALKKAIQADGPITDTSKRAPGPKVRNWMSGMLSKAVEASWQIELGIAGNLLSSALGYYYGWS